MPMWRLFYHVVFATAQRQHALTPEARQAARRLIWQKAEELGCVVHAVDAQPDHVHAALSIPPSRAVATVVGQLKGSSSHAIAANLPPWADFAWQEGYGVFTFGEGDLPDVVRYVRDQDARHARNDLWPDYEMVSTAAGSGADG